MALLECGLGFYYSFSDWIYFQGDILILAYQLILKKISICHVDASFVFDRKNSIILFFKKTKFSISSGLKKLTPLDATGYSNALF